MTAFLPYLTAFVAISCYAMLSPIAKKMQLDVPPLAFIAITMFFLCLFSAALSFITERNFSIQSISGVTWGWLGLFAFTNLMAFFFYLSALKQMPVAEYQLIFLISPIVGGMLAYFMLGEEFKTQYLIGLPIIGLGLYIALMK